MKRLNRNLALALLLGAATLNQRTAVGSQPAPEDVTVVVAGAADAEKADADKKKSIVIKRIEADGAEAQPKERTWLGVGLAEPDEALIAQLGLKDGAGLIITYVAKDSPAEKAGMKKSDVLLEMEGQTLVVAQQLQKLVQARKEGDKVTLKLLRGGKKESVSATLGKTQIAAVTVDSNNNFVWSAGDPGFKFISGDHAAHNDHMIVLKQALEKAKLDQKLVQVEVKRSLDEARKAMEEALRSTKDASWNLQQKKELEALARAGVFVPKNAAVTISSTEKSSKSMVRTDDTGTIVLVKNPKLRLTAHDSDGKMLFDGEVETKEQREKIPADLLKKVEPMIGKFSSGADE